MRILLTNDDGILAPGLAALHQAVADLGEIAVVAPESPQSAAGHAITVHSPLITQRVHVDNRFWGVSVDGRPADCVKLAFHELMDSPPDLVLSGINAGHNAGINVLYSGTVAAAAEGAMLGAAAVAFSLEVSDELDFARAGLYCRRVLETLLTGGLNPGELVSVNIPALRPGVPRGVRVARMSIAGVEEGYERRTDPRGRTYFWMSEKYGLKESPEDSDVVAIHEGYIAVTPLQVDLTAETRLARLHKLDWHDAQLP
jgi:5'-nucleotidase